MDLNFTPEDLAFRTRVREWFEANTPRHELLRLDERRAWIRKLHEAGYIGMGWPREYGGRNARPMEQAIVADEMARVNAPPAAIGLGVGIVGPTIIHHGTPEQKARAEDRGDHYEINGQKVWTSSGYLADWGLLIARTDPTVAKHLGISMFI